MSTFCKMLTIVLLVYLISDHVASENPIDGLKDATESSVPKEDLEGATESSTPTEGLEGATESSIANEGLEGSNESSHPKEDLEGTSESSLSNEGLEDVIPDQDLASDTESSNSYKDLEDASELHLKIFDLCIRIPCHSYKIYTPTCASNGKIYGNWGIFSCIRKCYELIGRDLRIVPLSQCKST